MGIGRVRDRGRGSYPGSVSDINRAFTMDLWGNVTDLPCTMNDVGNGLRAVPPGTKMIGQRAEAERHGDRVPYGVVDERCEGGRTRTPSFHVGIKRPPFL